MLITNNKYGVNIIILYYPDHFIHKNQKVLSGNFSENYSLFTKLLYNDPSCVPYSGLLLFKKFLSLDFVCAKRCYK